MTTDITIPTLGESISEGVVAAWLKSDGDYVERDEPVLELETDKITMEVPAPAAGVVHPGAEVGDTVAVGAKVGSIDESADKPADESKAESKSKSKSESQTASKQDTDAKSAKSGGGDADQATATKSKQSAGESGEDAASGAGGESEGEDIHATPLAKKLAGDMNIDLRELAREGMGTGPGGRIREQDVLNFSSRSGSGKPNGAAAKQAQDQPKPSPADEKKQPEFTGERTVTRERMSPLRQRIAARLVEAQHTAAMLTTFNECDMTNVMALRTRHKDAFQEKHGVKLGFMSFFVKAAVSALQEYPPVNSYIVDGDNGPEFERHHYCDIAVAVGTDKGLVVPVLRNCETLSFAAIEAGVNGLAEKARSGKLQLEDMQGGTFTISNGGVYGSMLSTPILNPPQSGILGMHNIIRRPVEDPDNPGAGQVVVRPMMYLALSYDHRIVDGAGAVGFLKHLKECIENPERLLLEV